LISHDATVGKGHLIVKESGFLYFKRIIVGNASQFPILSEFEEEGLDCIENWW
jgi:hypothetical protein